MKHLEDQSAAGKLTVPKAAQTPPKAPARARSKSPGRFPAVPDPETVRAPATTPLASPQRAPASPTTPRESVDLPGFAPSQAAQLGFGLDDGGFGLRSRGGGFSAAAFVGSWALADADVSQVTGWRLPGGLSLIHI